MVTIDFGNFPGMNMQNPGAMSTAVLSDFADFDFRNGAASGTELFILNTAGGPAYIRATGTFNYEPDNDPTSDSLINSIEVYTGPGGAYRMVMVGFNAFFSTLEGALDSRNLFTLYSGHALEILGSQAYGDTLVGGASADLIYGYGGTDVLIGGGGNDYLDGDNEGGPARLDTMSGGTGSDDYVVNRPNDVINELAGQGIDRAITSANYVLPVNVEDMAMLETAGAIDGTGNAGHNFMAANDSANLLSGESGNDTLLGYNGADLLEGGGGADRLLGGEGADILRGGDGNDTLFWDAADGIVNGGRGFDTLELDAGPLNLLNVGNGKIQNIERISLTGHGANRLTVSVNDVLDLSSTTDTLRVTGERADTVNLPAAFDEFETVDGYTRYATNLATVWIDVDINVI